MNDAELYTAILKATGRTGNIEQLILLPFSHATSTQKGVSSATLGEAMQFLIDIGLVSVRKEGGYWERYLHITEEAETIINTDNGMQIFLDELEKKKQAEKEREENELKAKAKETKSTRNIAYASLAIAIIAIFVQVFIWVTDKNEAKKTQIESSQLEKVLQIQQQVQQNSQDIQKILRYQDTLKKVLKMQKNEP